MNSKMKLNFTNNSILSNYYSNFINIKNSNKKITSNNLSELEILNLYDNNYILSEFDIYKYITAYDYLRDSLNCNKFNMTEGITLSKYTYNNILVDLFYMNIPISIIKNYPISVVFRIKQDRYEISDLTQTDLNKFKKIRDKKTYGDLTPINYLYDDMKIYKTVYSNYAGNSFTYFIFKLLTKLFLTEVYLYKFRGHILIYKELIGFYSNLIYNYPDPQQIRSISELIDSNEIETIKYQCIKVLDPKDINYLSICNIKLLLVDVNKKII